MTRALIIAGTGSGVGKTTVTLALLMALRQAGLRVRAAKNGPDYIDPQFHAAITGAPSLNFDSWAMSCAMMRDQLASVTKETDILLIEAAMGLYDGLNAEEGRRGSASDLAAIFGIPVMLVLDVTGQGQSAAMVADGFAHWRDDVNITGVFLNRVASPRHLALIKSALRQPLLGALKRVSHLQMPSRHLGLVQPSEGDAWKRGIADIAEQIAAENDLSEIFKASGQLSVGARALPRPPEKHLRPVAPPGQRIAIARDAAFTFTYPHILNHWRAKGADIVFFSPLEDEGPPADTDSCWLPGGYPELHAARLSACARFRAAMQNFARSHPVHGECGGYMVLGKSLEDADGVSHAMLDLLSHQTSFAKRRMSLGYREAHLEAQSALGGRGLVCRGHEFHYASVIEAGCDAPLATLHDGTGTLIGPAGGVRERVSGSFFHVISCR